MMKAIVSPKEAFETIVSLVEVETVTADIWALIGQTGTVVVGSIGIVVALRNQNRQLNAQISLEISGRFQELLHLFPTDAWLANRNLSRPLPASTAEVTECTLYTLQFIADVYHLHKSGFISSRLWKLWEREIIRTLSGPVFLREWPDFRAEFDYSQDFVGYINSIMRSNPLRQDYSGVALHT